MTENSTNRIATALILLVVVTRTALAIPAFPGAEGFGAAATGGRRGKVIYVTTLNPKGPGSLGEALATPGPAYVLFKVSGVINGKVSLKQGQKTIAGHTSPGGIIVNGIQWSYGKDDLNTPNVILRHLRSRMADDAIRVTRTRNVIVDHCSFAWASDECFELTYASNITVQNCILAETLGNHANLGGMLLSYGSDSWPTDSLSIHHNMWHRIMGRMPEITCHTEASFCEGHTFHIELSCNLLWDGNYIMAANKGTPYSPTIEFFYKLNWVNNLTRPREDQISGFLNSGPMASPKSSTYFSGNKMYNCPGLMDYKVATANRYFDCNPNFKITINSEVRDERLPFPPVTYTPTDSLMDYSVRYLGAFPRDSMDRRFLASVANNTIDMAVERNSDAYGDAFIFDWTTPPAPPADSDGDGMPDLWEAHNGLDPWRQDHNGTELSKMYTGIEGYTNLECYINALSDSLVHDSLLHKGEPQGYMPVRRDHPHQGLRRAGGTYTVSVYSLDGKLIARFPLTDNFDGRVPKEMVASAGQSVCLYTVRDQAQRVIHRGTLTQF